VSRDDLATYYRLRTDEYDRVYAKAERQSDIRVLAATLEEAVADRQVLELAAGTGYWTPTIANVARSLVATDINAESLAVAQRREYVDADVKFEVADAYALEEIEGQFDCVVAGFFLSHVERENVDGFLASVFSKLPMVDRLILFDNNYVEGSSHPITRSSVGENTYQTRMLDSGATFEVLKNFYTPEELQNLGRHFDPNCRVHNLEYYWFLQIDRQHS
jgi:SAM-dependent methyltransferase